MINKQKEICSRFNVNWVESSLLSKVGIAENVKLGIMPIHGLRHHPKDDSTGWYIWAGDYSDSSDFFVPLHVNHLYEWCPDIIKYLGLPPGFRFLVDNKGHEDIWIDNTLLSID